MTYVKLILFLLIILLNPCVSADDEDEDDESMFDAMFGGFFVELETTLKQIIMVLVPLSAFISFLAIVWGSHTNNMTLHDRGVSCLVAIVKGAVIVFIVLNLFNYLYSNYW